MLCFRVLALRCRAALRSAVVYCGVHTCAVTDDDARTRLGGGGQPRQ
jgi:hypothetical protein